jgi:hypothetical protein
MIKWEYKILVYPEWSQAESRNICETPETLESILNGMGVEGWELVSHGPLALSLPSFGLGVGVGAFTFKRPLE